MEAALELIKSQEGFVGIHPIDIWKNVLIFDTLNHAKAARNVLSANGCPVGQVVPVFGKQSILHKYVALF